MQRAHHKWWQALAVARVTAGETSTHGIEYYNVIRVLSDRERGKEFILGMWTDAAP